MNSRSSLPRAERRKRKDRYPGHNRTTNKEVIRLTELAEAGHFNKTHGIKGEISATLDIDIDLDEVKCIVISVEGIFVPFFVNSCRPKTADTCLLTIDGIDSEAKARQLVNRPFYILRSDIPDDPDGDDDDEGLYASDLIGFKVTDTSLGDVGTITGINDSTQNVLFIIETADGKEIYVPVADEFIEEIDSDSKTVRTDLPEGLVSLNT